MRRPSDAGAWSSAVRLLLVVNASASSVTARGRVVIQKALSADHDVTAVETNRRGHATRLAQGAANDGVDVVVCLGGDGTLNEIANGLAGTETALAALPGGSTNVFARTIGLPNDPIEATAVLVDALARDQIEPVGLGSVNGRYFLFHVGLGFDAVVVQQVERRAGLKRYAGHVLFIYGTFSAWLRHYDRSRPRFAVHYADGTVVDDGYFSICLNTNPYTYLGNRPFDLTPEATLDRGLSMLTLRSLSHPDVAGRRLVGARRRPRPAPPTARPPADGRRQADGPRLRTLPVPGRRRLPRRGRPPRVPPRTRHPPPGQGGLDLIRPYEPVSDRTDRATSGTLVTMPSTPSAASSAMRPGSSTVHTFTSRPRSWHSVDEAGVDRRVERVQCGMACGGSLVDDPFRLVERECQQRGLHRRVDVAHSDERAGMERRHQDGLRPSGDGGRDGLRRWRSPGRSPGRRADS